MKPLHLVAVSPTIPSPSTGGGGNWASSLLEYLRSLGHRVTLVSFAKYGSLDLSAKAEYEAIGIEVKVVPFELPPPQKHGLVSKVRLFFFPEVQRVWPECVTVSGPLSRVLEELSPDCVMPWGSDALMLTHEFTGAPRVAYLAEGPHVNAYVNWRYNSGFSWRRPAEFVRTGIIAFLKWNMLDRVYLKALRRLDAAAFIAPHYEEWGTKRGLTNLRFIRMLVPDPIGPGWRSAREKLRRPLRAPIKILMIGHLHSTSNRAGLPLFFEKVLPVLERDWGAEKFEVHFVGRDSDMPGRFSRWRKHPSLIWRGAVYPADREFLESDILLVTVPAETGPRTRIINGFTFGSCVVAHSANALGIPELRHGENILLGDSGEAIARQVMLAAGDPELRKRLGEAGRATYEKAYSDATAGQEYMRLISETLAVS